MPIVSPPTETAGGIATTCSFTTKLHTPFVHAIVPLLDLYWFSSTARSFGRRWLRDLSMWYFVIKHASTFEPELRG